MVVPNLLTSFCATTKKLASLLAGLLCGVERLVGVQEAGKLFPLEVSLSLSESKEFEDLLRSLFVENKRVNELISLLISKNDFRF